MMELLFLWTAQEHTRSLVSWAEATYSGKWETTVSGGKCVLHNKMELGKGKASNSNTPYDNSFSKEKSYTLESNKQQSAV